MVSGTVCETVLKQMNPGKWPKFTHYLPIDPSPEHKISKWTLSKQGIYQIPSKTACHPHQLEPFSLVFKY